MKIEYGPEFEKSLKKLIWQQRTYWLNPKNYYREVKWFIQRGMRGYSDRDLWNLNDHIARQVIAFLDMKRMSIISWNGTEKDEPRATALEAELRWLMEQVLAGWDWDKGGLTDVEYRKRYDRAKTLFGRWWDSLWD